MLLFLQYISFKDMNHSCYYKNKYSYHKKMSNRIFIFIYNQLVHANFYFYTHYIMTSKRSIKSWSNISH
jgi:hypothetical protein